MKKILFTNFAPIIKYGLMLGFQEQGWETRFLLPDECNVEGFTKAVDEFFPDYVLTEGGIDKQGWIFPVVKEKGLRHIYWAIEDPVFNDSLANEWASISCLTLTPCVEMLEAYQKRGQNAICIPFAIQPSYHAWRDDSRFSHLDAIFIGNNYDYYETRLKAYHDVLNPFLESGKRFEVYGNEWWIDKKRPYSIDESFYKGYMSYEDSVRAYSNVKIVLGVHSVVDSMTMQSMRTFEVLGCQGFFLSSYAKGVESMFENHVHLVYSKSPEETKEYMDYYLTHEDERFKVAVNGQKEVYQKHTYSHRVKTIEDALSGQFHV
jgi:spore maturation protein CgeB